MQHTVGEVKIATSLLLLIVSARIYILLVHPSQGLDITNLQHITTCLFSWLMGLRKIATMLFH